MTTVFDPGQAPSNQVNILDNGGFEIWQRGTTFTNPANATYTADRWQITHITPNPTYTISRSSSTVDTGLYSMEINVTNFNSTPFIQLVQYIENYIVYAGQTVTLSMRVWSNTAGCNLELFDFASHFAQSANHPGDSAWHTLTCTLTCGTTAQMTSLTAAFNAASGTNGMYFIDSAMLVVGSTAANFVALHPQVDMQRCQRYYEIPGTTYGTTFRALGINNGPQYQLSNYVQFKATKRIIPTMTITGTIIWEQGSTTNQVANYSPAAANADESGFEFAIVKSAGGNFPSLAQGQWTASADL